MAVTNTTASSSPTTVASKSKTSSTQPSRRGFYHKRPARWWGHLRSPPHSQSHYRPLESAPDPRRFRASARAMLSEYKDEICVGCAVVGAALVDEFWANPIICGIAAQLWLRFVASTQVFHPDWACNTILDSEKGQKKEHKETYYGKQPTNLFKERMAMVWCKSLKKTIPLYCSLAVWYLACHIAREPVLPIDILKWAMEGKIIPYACWIQKWAMPPDLWLSANDLRLPTRVCVMSILIVAIRILYNINGFGTWETTLSSKDYQAADSEEDDAAYMLIVPTLEGDFEESVSPSHNLRLIVQSF